MSAIGKPTKSRGEEKLEDVLGKTAKMSAWQDNSDRKMMSRSLGHNVSMHVSQPFATDTMSSSDSDSDTDDYDEDEEEEEEEEEERKQRRKSSPELKTRSLGRNELYSTGNKRASNFVPVSERSAAYKELVMSTSQPHPCKTTTSTSIIRLRNHTSASRIEDNPFFRQDRRGVSNPIPIQQSKSISVMDNSTRAKASLSSAGGSFSPSITPSSSVSSPGRPGISSGMSVQMRIRIWKEKEEVAKSQAQEKLQASKLNNRKSLQQFSLLSVQSGNDEKTEEEEEESRVAQSDDELAKGGSMSVDRGGTGKADHSYEIIDNIVNNSVRLDEASSSSSLSEDSGDNNLIESKQNSKQNGHVPSSSSKTKSERKKKSEGGKKKGWNPLNRILKQKKKQGSVDSSSSKSSTSSLAYKRPHTKSKRRLVSDLSREEEGVSSADDVFSPVHQANGTSKLQNGELGKYGHPLTSDVMKPVSQTYTNQSMSQSNSVEELEEKSSVATGRSSDRKEERSISTDIRSIINALGSSEESTFKELGSPVCNIIVENSTSGE